MDRWRGKIAVVIGASSGIGAARAKKLTIAGLTVIGVARRVHLIEALKASLPAEATSRLHAFKCDITKEEEVVQTFALIRERFGGVDALVNSAGMAKASTIFEPGKGQVVRDTFNVNVVGQIYCAREAFQSMSKRSVEGHIIIRLVHALYGKFKTVGGQRVLDMPAFYVYTGSKFAMAALSEAMRYELVRHQQSRVKVTSIIPGVTDTPIIDGFADLEEVPKLQPEDIADAIQYALSTPPNVQISELTIRATGALL